MGLTALCALRRKSCYGFLVFWKNPSPSARFEFMNFESSGKHATTRLPRTAFCTLLWYRHLNWVIENVHLKTFTYMPCKICFGWSHKENERPEGRCLCASLLYKCWSVAVYFVCVCVCVCVCVWEWVCEWVSEWEWVSVSECEWVWVSVSEWVWVSVSEWVSEWVREQIMSEKFSFVKTGSLLEFNLIVRPKTRSITDIAWQHRGT
jgi:hypothetical protein